MIRIASINQDRGIAPGRAKGAAVHLAAMREAFGRLGAEVACFDLPDPGRLRTALAQAAPVHFDLVYERYTLGRDAGAEFAAHQGLPLVLEVNAPLAEEAARFRGMDESEEDRERDARLFRQAACVLAVSTATGAYAVQRGAKPESVLIRPNGIDPKRFHAGVSGREARRKHVPENAFVLGFHGRERPWHGFGGLVQVTGRLLQRGIPAHLLIVGDGDFKALERLSPNHYTRLGWQAHKDIPGLVAAFDVLPLTYPPDMPTYFSPLKLAEAMALGVPPVVPAIGDLPKLVSDGFDGLIYPAGDLDQLEHLLTRLAREPGERSRIGRHASESARRHSWDDIAATLLSRLGLPAGATTAQTAHG